MNKRDYSRKAEQVKRLPLPKMLEGQVFLTLNESGRCDVRRIPVEEWDAWVASLCEEITGVKRDVWDMFARQRFLNEMLKEGILDMQEEEDGTITLTETEEKTSAEMSDEGAEQAQEGSAS